MMAFIVLLMTQFAFENLLFHYLAGLVYILLMVIITQYISKWQSQRRRRHAPKHFYLYFSASLIAFVLTFGLKDP